MVVRRPTKFQFTPARGGRRRQRCDRDRPHGFNSRPHVAGDGSGIGADHLSAKFQFTPARGGRLFLHLPLARVTSFNSRPHVAGDSMIGTTGVAKRAFQFTPARGGRPLNARAPKTRVYVSIHARTWRATRPLAHFRELFEFQFTPARGGRPTVQRDAEAVAGFNSRPHVAGDRTAAGRQAPQRRFNSRPHVAGDFQRPVKKRRLHVSIHARTWRATPVHCCTSLWLLFQFTPARGGRRSAVRTSRASIYVCFNSRPHVAGDQPKSDGKCDNHVFQFTPARGGRLQKFALEGRGEQFQFTPARGGRQVQ